LSADSSRQVGRVRLVDRVMSELDLDIRAVTSASFGARILSSDVAQVQAAPSDTANVPSFVNSGATAPSQPVGQPNFRYDSFRFVYQSDYGRIVLVDQNPETGKAVSQIPSERALRLYAEQKLADVAQSGGSAGAVQGSTDTAHRGTVSSQAAGKATGALTSTTVAQPVVQAPAVPVSTPSPAFTQPSVAPVNITI
jgi:hypothetical protein